MQKGELLIESIVSIFIVSVSIILFNNSFHKLNNISNRIDEKMYQIIDKKNLTTYLNSLDPVKLKDKNKKISGTLREICYEFNITCDYFYYKDKEYIVSIMKEGIDVKEK